MVPALPAGRDGRLWVDGAPGSSGYDYLTCMTVSIITIFRKLADLSRYTMRFGDGLA